MEQTRQKLRTTSFMKWGVITMLVTTLLSVVFVMLSTLPVSAVASVPTKMNFQGRLTNASGIVLPNGSYNMKFRIFSVSSGGIALWTETRDNFGSTGVTVTNGLFSVRLGDVTTLPTSLFTGSTLYFEIELPTPATATCSTSACASFTEGAMTPRNQLATSAYAYQADMLDGLDSSDFAQLTAANTFTALNTYSGGGKMLLKTNDANEFQVTKSAGTNLFNVATDSTNQVSIGSQTTDATAILFSLDSYNSGTDPTGAAGAMYYNSSLNAFRCYQNTGWTNCIGAGSSPTLQNAYDNSGTPATITTSSSTKGVLIAAGSTFDQAKLFEVQTAGAVDMFTVDTTNNRVQIGNATADTTGALLVLDTKTGAGDPTGVDGAMYFNSNLSEFRCYRDGLWQPCDTKPIDRGWEFQDDFLAGGTSAATTTTTTPQIGAIGWASATVTTACVAFTYNNNAAPTPSADHPGILKMLTSATATASAGCRIYMGSSVAGAGTMLLAPGQVIKSTVALGSVTAGAIIMRVGADASTVTSNAQSTTSGVWWEANPTTNANWRYCYDDGSVAQCANSTVSLGSVNAFARLEIDIISSSAVTFKVNGTAFALTGITLNTGTLVKPSILCNTGTTATSSTPCYVDYFQMRGDASAAR